ncbi:ABC transporter permease [Thermococcus sp.]
MITAIAEKEFKDYLTGRRFLILFGFLLTITILALLQVKYQMMTWSAPGESHTFKVYEVMWGVNYYIGLVGGIFALALGFDAITREREDRTLKVLMGHPVFRDQVILGKLLGGALTLAVAVVITGMVMTGILMWMGITIDNYARLATYFGFIYLYLLVFFTMAVAFSAYSKKSGNALMYALVLFLTLTIVVMSVAPIVAHYAVGPRPKMPEELNTIQVKMSGGNVSMEDMQKYKKLMEEYQNKTMEWSRRYWKIQEYINIISPQYDFNQIANYVLNPRMKSLEEMVRVEYTPNGGKPPEYSLMESLSFAKKEIIFMLAYMIIGFVAAYLGFVRAEIR